MNAIMMYMSGNSLQIFSIMMVWMLFTNPVKGILATNQAFVRYETDGTRGRLLTVKLVYVLMQLLALGLGLWKVNAMGLLPYVIVVLFLTLGPSPESKLTVGRNTRSDWLAWETAREPAEEAIFAL